MMQFLISSDLKQIQRTEAGVDPCEGGNDRFRYLKMVAMDVLASKTLFLIHLHNYTTEMVSKYVANNY